MLRLLLESSDYFTDCCENGAEALDKMNKKSFGVVLTDHRMPGMNGDELTRMIRSLYPEVFIVGFSVEVKERAFIDAGANIFISKEQLAHRLLPTIKNRR